MGLWSLNCCTFKITFSSRKIIKSVKTLEREMPSDCCQFNLKSLPWFTRTLKKNGKERFRFRNFRQDRKLQRPESRSRKLEKHYSHIFKIVITLNHENVNMSELRCFCPPIATTTTKPPSGGTKTNPRRFENFLIPSKKALLTKNKQKSFQVDLKKKVETCVEIFFLESPDFWWGGDFVRFCHLRGKKPVSKTP